MIGKLGDILNADVGVIVKGAGKVLNADVGKVLKTDVGDIAKGAGRILKTDLGDLLRAPPKNGSEVPAVAEAEPAAAAPSTAAPAETAAPAATPTPAVGAKLTEESVSRAKRDMPEGSDLAVLLPAKAGIFSRPATSPAGTIANDPVNATYTCGEETIIMRLTLCWDEDEARERLTEVQSYTADGRRMGPDGGWILGIAEGGVVFAWVRDSYFFLALSPKGTSSLARFLAGFPY